MFFTNLRFAGLKCLRCVLPGTSKKTSFQFELRKLSGKIAENLRSRNLLRILLLMVIACSLIQTGCKKNEGEIAQQGIITHSLINAQKNKKSTISVGLYDYSHALSLIAANGGLRTVSSSQLASDLTKIVIVKKDDTVAVLKDLYAQRIDIAVLPYWEVIQSASQLEQKSISVFAITGFSDGAHYGVCSDKNKISSVKDLKNKKVACVEGSVAESMAKFLLRLNSLSPDTVEWVYEKNDADAIASLNNSRADAAFLNSAHKETEAYRVIASSSAWPRLMPYVLVAGEKWLLSHQSEAKKITDSMIAQSYDLGAFRKRIDQIGELDSDIDMAQRDTLIPATAFDSVSFFGVNDSSPIQALYIDTIEDYLPENYSTKRQYLFSSHINGVFVSHLSNSSVSIIPSQKNDTYELFSIAVSLSSGEISKEEYASMTATLTRLVPFLDRYRIQVSYMPAKDSADRYAAESALDDFHRALMKTMDLSYERITRNYESLYQPFQTSYSGPYTDKESVVVTIFR